MYALEYYVATTIVCDGYFSRWISIERKCPRCVPCDFVYALTSSPYLVCRFHGPPQQLHYDWEGFPDHPQKWDRHLSYSFDSRTDDTARDLAIASALQIMNFCESALWENTRNEEMCSCWYPNSVLWPGCMSCAYLWCSRDSAIKDSSFLERLQVHK